MAVVTRLRRLIVNIRGESGSQQELTEGRLVSYYYAVKSLLSCHRKTFLYMIIVHCRILYLVLPTILQNRRERGKNVLTVSTNAGSYASHNATQ